MSDAPRSHAVDATYAHCRMLARHYENFPVGSVLFPRHLRDHFNAVYAFARAADDMADEGNVAPEERLRRLDAWEHELDAAARGSSHEPVFVALGDTMARLHIPADPFRKLLSAFRQDVSTVRYETFADVLDYCSRSADPVGEIVLRLFGMYNAHTAPLSDCMCTALQLANFWQDVAVDYAKGRIYIPLEDMARFGVDEATLRQRPATAAFRRLMAFEVDRTAALFDRSAALIPVLHGRLRVEIAWILASGRQVLTTIRGNDFDVLTKSNRLSGLTRAWLLCRALITPQG